MYVDKTDRLYGQAFPAVSEQYLKHDLAYPAMVSMLPQGWLGLVVASLVAAYMSTIATQLNWGASYFVQDFYVPFVNPKSPPKRQGAVGRLTMVGLMVGNVLVTLVLEHSKGVFDLLLQIGTGWLLYAAGGKTELFVRGWTALGIAAVATVSPLTLVGARKAAPARKSS